jgi:hypothetical protein
VVLAEGSAVGAEVLVEEAVEVRAREIHTSEKAEERERGTALSSHSTLSQV